MPVVCDCFTILSDLIYVHFFSQEKRIVAPIRCGGVPQSYSKQLLLVGDSAGHVDPLTGMNFLSGAVRLCQ